MSDDLTDRPTRRGVLGALCALVCTPAAAGLPWQPATPADTPASPDWEGSERSPDGAQGQEPDIVVAQRRPPGGVRARRGPSRYRRRSTAFRRRRAHAHAAFRHRHHHGRRPPPFPPPPGW